MLVSMYVIAYNHQHLVEEAIAGALAQDYSPLEIVISDDHSTDDTWSVVQRSVAAYQGPHMVKIRRNSANLGIARHVNEIWRECRGEWIVASAGDDVSSPNRISRTMQAAASADDVTLVQAWLREVDERGKTLGVNTLGSGLEKGEMRLYGLGERLREESYGPHGAAMAYSRRLVDRFGPLPDGVIFEDDVLKLRAELLGRALVLGEPLVDHRNHPGQVTRTAGVYEPAVRDARFRARALSAVVSSRQNLEDVTRVACDLEPAMAAALDAHYAARVRYFERKEKALTRPWPERLVHLAACALRGARIAPFLRDELARAILPDPIYRWIRSRRA